MCALRCTPVQMPVGRVLLEEKRLRLAARQAQLRAAVEAEQQELLAMPVRGWLGAWTCGQPLVMQW